jgi:hypothetical protein
MPVGVVAAAVPWLLYNNFRKKKKEKGKVTFLGKEKNKIAGWAY